MATSVSPPNENIFAIIRFERSQFLHRQIEVVRNYWFNQYDTVKLIHLYYNSKFKTGNIDNQGDRKFFYNINKYRCDVATVRLNFDIKDFRSIATASGDFHAAWLAEQGIKQWMRDVRYRKFLNDVARDLPIYGTVVAKKAKTPDGTNVSLVDLRNLFNNQVVDSLQDSWVHERHFMTPSEMVAMKPVWNSANIDKAIQDFRDHSPESYEDDSDNIQQTGHAPFIEVVERYGEVEQEDGSFKKMMHVVAGFDMFDQDEQGQITMENGVILFEKQVSKWPYEEVHYSRTPGRWLGVGIVEELFDSQVRRNELVNDKAKAMKISSLHIFNTQDETFAKNILEDLENGDVLVSRSPVTPIANEERNLAAFSSDERQWDEEADRLTFTSGIVRGDEPPATQPLGTSILQQRSAGGVFGFKRENLADFHERIIEDFVMPEILKSMDETDVLSFTADVGELRRKFDEPVVKYFAWKAVEELAKSSGRLPRREEFEFRVQEETEKLQKKEDQRFVIIPQGYVKSLKLRVKIIADDEDVDLDQRIQRVQFALSMIAGNPSLLQVPEARKLLGELLEAAGLSPLALPSAPASQAGVGLNQGVTRPGAGQLSSAQELVSALSGTNEDKAGQSPAAQSSATGAVSQLLGAGRGA